jgi:hypothetical protein
MQAGMATNRALQLRAMEELRQRLARALPSAESLADGDADQLRQMGGGRLGAVGIVVPDAGSVHAVARLVEANVRRTDLVLTHAEDTVLVLAPGLDPLGGESLIGRLEPLLSEHLPETPVLLGAAYRSRLSLHGWHPSDLAAEARRRALTSPEDIEQVA